MYTVKSLQYYVCTFRKRVNGRLTCGLWIRSSRGHTSGFCTLRIGSIRVSGGEVECTREDDVTRRRVLAIDGGGIKGVIPAAFLAAIEETTGERIVENFDLIAGTSTGGIIALGLGLGLSASEILDFYLEKGPGVFSQAGAQGRFRGRVRGWGRLGRSLRRLLKPKYQSDGLEEAIGSVFGMRCLGDSKTRLVIPAFDARRKELYVFKTAHNERLAMDWRARAVDVALATAAAPTYFAGRVMANGVGLIDGGVWANNPVGMAVVEAVGVLGWKYEQVRVLSLGCSEESLAIPLNGGLATFYRKGVDMLMCGQSKCAMGTASILLRDSVSYRRLFRYDTQVPRGTFAMDAVKQIDGLRGIGFASARSALPEVKRVFLGQVREPFVPFHGGSGAVAAGVSGL